MRRSLLMLAVVLGLISPVAGLLAQTSPKPEKAAAAKPALYPFVLDQQIPVHARAVPVDFGGIVFSPLEAADVTFTFDEKDNHLTAIVSCTAVRVLDAVRTVHIALFDENQFLLGTASAAATIKKFILNNAPVAEPVSLTLDFGESATYKACKLFQISVAGRGRSSVQYGLKDADELLKRLTNARSPEGQWDAARALGKLGDPVLSGLQGVALKGGPSAPLALRAIAYVATPAAASIFDALFQSPDTPDSRRLELYDLVTIMGPVAFEPLAAELGRATDEALQLGVINALPTLHDPRVGPLLIRCFMDEKRYYGAVRARIAIALQQCDEKAAVPLLIAALRDPSGTVRFSAARAVEGLTNTSIMVEWEGPMGGAWINAPLEAREVAAKRWEEWWKANSAKFGVR